MGGDSSHVLFTILEEVHYMEFIDLRDERYKDVFEMKDLLQELNSDTKRGLFTVAATTVNRKLWTFDDVGNELTKIKRFYSDVVRLANGRKDYYKVALENDLLKSYDFKIYQIILTYMLNDHFYFNSCTDGSIDDITVDITKNDLNNIENNPQYRFVKDSIKYLDYFMETQIRLQDLYDKECTPDAILKLGDRMTGFVQFEERAATFINNPVLWPLKAVSSDYRSKKPDKTIYIGEDKSDLYKVLTEAYESNPVFKGSGVLEVYYLEPESLFKIGKARCFKTNKGGFNIIRTYNY